MKMENKLINIDSITEKTLEIMMLKEQQVKCPVIHHTGGGLYIREVRIPAGSLALGHFQNFRHMNIFSSGQLFTIQNGIKTILKSPMVFMGNLGRKFGYALENIVWLNVYPTTETNIEKLENLLFTKSKEWKQSEVIRLKELSQKNNIDFKKILQEFNISEKQVQIEAFNTKDLIETPPGSWKFSIQQSVIHGKGVFATADIEIGELISPINMFNKQTPVGRYINHSTIPNAKMILIDEIIWLIAISHINGYIGGQIGEEITINYRQSLQLRRKV